jgi:rhomboid protease GluP
MAQKFSIEISIQPLSQHQFLVLCCHALTHAGWGFNIINDSYIAGKTKTSMTSWGEDILIQIDNNNATITSKNTEWKISDWGRNEKNTTKFLESLDAVKTAYTPEVLQQKYEEWDKETAKERADFLERYQQGDLTATEKIALQQGGNYATYAIMGINVLVFIAMCFMGVNIFNPSVESLITWGGNLRELTTGGEWWRLITSVFLHGGIIHLALNMYALFFIGSYLEPILGRTKFVIAYLCTGLLASLTSIWWSDARVSVGASGAIFGMYGLFISLLTTKLIDKGARNSLLQSIGIFVFYNLIYGMKGSIDNAAHIGGLISGFVLGYGFYWGIAQPKKQQYATALVVVVTLLVTTAYLFQNKSSNAGFKQMLFSFSKLEEDAMLPFKNEKLEGSSLANTLSKTSLPDWQKAKIEIEKVMNLELPEKEYKLRMHLKDYVNLRIEETELLIAINRGDSTIEKNNRLQQIESSLVTKLGLINEVYK